MTELTETNEQKSSVKIIKGQKNSYGWEIKAYCKEESKDGDIEALYRIKLIDEKLRKEYGDKNDN